MFLKNNWEVIGKEGKRYGYNDISDKSLQVCLRVVIFLSKEKKKPVALMSNATPKSVSFTVLYHGQSPYFIFFALVYVRVSVGHLSSRGAVFEHLSTIEGLRAYPTQVNFRAFFYFCPNQLDFCMLNQRPHAKIQLIWTTIKKALKFTLSPSIVLFVCLFVSRFVCF